MRATQTYNGGFQCRWGHGLGTRWGNAARPLARLALDGEGVEVRFRRGLPGSGRFRFLMLWSEIQRVQAVRGFIPIPGNVGVAFYGDRRLAFWTGPRERTRIFDEVRRLAPPGVIITSDAKYPGLI